MKFFKVIILTVLVFGIAHLLAFPLGKAFAARYATAGWLQLGSFSGYDAGFLFGYIIAATIIFSIAFKHVKYGFYTALPVLVFDVLVGSYDPLLWMHLVLLAAGLLIAHLFLLLTRKAGTKLF